MSSVYWMATLHFLWSYMLLNPKKLMKRTIREARGVSKVRRTANGSLVFRIQYPVLMFGCARPVRETVTWCQKYTPTGVRTAFKNVTLSLIPLIIRSLHAPTPDDITHVLYTGVQEGEILIDKNLFILVNVKATLYVSYLFTTTPILVKFGTEIDRILWKDTS